MKIFLFLMSSFLFFTNCGNGQQQFHPEDVIQTIGQYNLKYKHILAYVNMEMDGEDPSLINDPSYIQSLTQEGIEEFAEDPASFIADMDVHYEVMQSIATDINNNITPQDNYVQPENDWNSVPQTPPVTPNSQWKQLLTGSLLYYTVTQSHVDLFVQTTQYMHLCPNGTALFYEESGGGGGDITAPRELVFSGSANWNVLEQGGQAYLQMSMQGAMQNFPMSIINQKIQIQGLGTFSVQRGGAQCQ